MKEDHEMAETRRKLHTHTHTGSFFNGLKQIGTICFAFLFFMFSTNLFATDPNIAADATTANCDNATLETYSGTSNLQANWTPNPISLSWYNENTKMTV